MQLTRYHARFAALRGLFSLDFYSHFNTQRLVGRVNDTYLSPSRVLYESFLKPNPLCGNLLMSQYKLFSSLNTSNHKPSSMDDDDDNMSIPIPTEIKDKKKPTKTKSKDDIQMLFTNNNEFCYTVVDTVESLDLWLQQAKQKKFVCFSSQLSVKKIHEKVLVGLSLCLEPKVSIYIPLTHVEESNEEPNTLECVEKLQNNELLRKLKVEIFENSDIKKIGYNIKQQIHHLSPYNIHIENFDDIMVMSYVLNCGKHDQDLETLLDEYIFVGDNTKEKLYLLSEKEILGIGKKKVTFAKATIFNVGKFVCQRSDYIMRLYHIFKASLDKSARLTNFYNKIELPLISTLAYMEQNGVMIDHAGLKAMEEEYWIKMNNLEKSIKEALTAEHDSPDELNINSTRQLGEALFNKFGHEIEWEKSKKSDQYILDATTLQKMSKIGHEVAQWILDYRAFKKLHGTYIVSLQEHINPYTHRIHTTFQNAVTLTGRLSSANPNIQNIPIRTAEGKMIRKMFMASPGHTLMKVDYSQVELRILAQVANIDVLKDAFMHGKDVHSITASQVFGVPVEKVEKDMRRKAKTINFGIIYGMSYIGLSKSLQVSAQEARNYINQYFKQYPGIKRYMENIKKFVNQNLYVNTWFGRRCWIKSKDGGGIAERTAINAPIQGTSADVTKIAMNLLYRELKQRNLKTKMIIQVHDEIVFEAPYEEVEIVKPIIQSTMENAVHFNVNGEKPFEVPLTVDVTVSERWVSDDD